MSAILKALQSSDEISSVLGDVEAHTLPLAVTGLSAVHKAVLIGAMSKAAGRRALIITEDEGAAMKLSADLNALFGAALFVPAKDVSLLGAEAKSRDYEHKKLGALAKIAEKDYRFAVLGMESAIQLTIPQAELKKRSFTIRKGLECGREILIEKLSRAGYVRSDMVDGVGQFSCRGEIVDFFSPQAENPVRVDFWGDTIESIFTFSTLDQRRLEMLRTVRIVPVLQTLFESEEDFCEKLGAYLKRIARSKNEALKRSLRTDLERAQAGVMPADIDRYFPLAYEKAESIFEYCSADLLILSESAKSKRRLKDNRKLLREEFKTLTESGVIAKGLDTFYVTDAQLNARMEAMQPIYLDTLPRGSYELPLKSLYSLAAHSLPLWQGKMAQLEEDIASVAPTKSRCVLMAGTAKNAKAVYNDLIADGISAVYMDAFPSAFPPGTVCVVPGTLSAGFHFPQAKFYLYAQGTRALKSKKRKNRYHRAGEIHSLEELYPGDYIVHTIHGIGIYAGVMPVTSQGVTKDYIKITYAKGDVLYVPVTQLDLVSKYIGGGENARVKINTLGSADWTRTKAKAKAGIVKTAQELIELYAKRQTIQGFAFPPDDDLQRDFELRFPYEETLDQKRCVEEIKKDMYAPHPMDRLLCGDVGFGKTEVALRAAFKAMENGKQVAMLVPTTILAMQHFRTVSARMENFALNIEMLSRFKTPAEQKRIKEKLKRGQIDMVVGTHKLIAKDIEFRDLGLLIIDEEQRFGVAQKEKIKERFPGVDVLTLSATPIPRTLSMSLSGIRDMSLIEEAPQDRHPIQTYVMEYDLGVVCEAMRKELRRGGQVYYLHNKIEDIEFVAGRIHSEIPDAKIGIAHGAMSERQLSDIWQKLLEGVLDILVCTTIIETGIDVPNVNTLIIEDADRMGLAQLHQIRGRVGRSSRRANAYLTYRAEGALSDVATRRLEAVREFTEFGAGFRIAMRDLEIRGAGNILGSQQHGQMEAVGYDTYVKLLAEAVAEQKGEALPASTEECLVDLPITAHISEAYIPALSQRIAMYRRISDIRCAEDAADVRDELCDRYGKPPATVEGLIEISLMRAVAAKAHIYEITQNGMQAILKVKDFDFTVLPQLQKGLKRVIQLHANNAKPYLSIKLIKGDKLTEIVNRALAIMNENEESQNA
ncbi:MAG: transcription-repair coupling factor [Ruminococcaceae bacterium]|nr:transcription-repair coupling factor [Oscillospiraceae bacterium]